MAASFKQREAGVEQTDGAHFVAVSGDESGWFVDRANRALREIDPAFHAEIIALSGLSTGEDVVLGPKEWGARPEAAAGAAVAAVPDGDGWGLLLLWCAENRIPVNLDQAYYDPRALNVVTADDAARAAALWSDEETVERIFLAEGEDHRGWNLEKGEKGSVAVAGLATRAPADPRLATARDDAVVVTSTRRRPGQAPELVLGLAQWNAEHRDDVVRMLAALFTATQQLDKSRRDLAEKRIQPRSGEDARWQATQAIRDLFGGSADHWYDATDAAAVKREDGTVVEIGGVLMAGLQRNLAFFGLGRSGPDGGRVAYERYASLRDQTDGGGASAPATNWEDLFEPDYLRDVVRRYPDLARADPTLPSFDLRSPDEPQELTYYLAFGSRSAELAPGSDATLFEVLAEIIRAGDARFEIHGHTDSAGSPESNLDLSRRRSQAVYDWLKNKLGTEFPPTVEVIPHGESELAVQDSIDGNFVPELMAKNRRVILKIFPKKSSSA
jgi:OOP family OmpA-OmpF porin